MTILDSHELLTPKDLSGFLKVSRAAISQWCHKGDLPFLQIGSAIRFEPKSIKAWLEEKRRVPQGQ